MAAARGLAPAKTFGRPSEHGSRHAPAVELFRNVRYFGGKQHRVPIAVLGAYPPDRCRSSSSSPSDDARLNVNSLPAAGRRPGGMSSTRNPRLFRRTSVAPIGFAMLLATLFAVNYLSSGHEPIATDMPFGVVGSSPLPERPQGPLFSLDVTEFADPGGRDRTRWMRARSTGR